MGPQAGKQLLWCEEGAALHSTGPIHGQQSGRRCESGALFTAARCMAPQTQMRSHWGLPLRP